MKQLFDFLMALFGVIILSPIFVIVSLLVRINFGRPVIFKQLRPGLNAVPFCMYKFRTMTETRDSRGKLLPDDVRLTKLGRSLRNYSVDELPELFNVLKCEMSLVGPRPLLMEYLPLYSKDQAIRHLVRPGITGWAQINGRNAISWAEKLSLDSWYVQNRTFWLDIKILLITVVKVFKKEGIHQKGHATVTPFTGIN